MQALIVIYNSTETSNSSLLGQSQSLEAKKKGKKSYIVQSQIAWVGEE